MSEEILEQKNPKPPVQNDAQDISEEKVASIVEAILFSAGDAVALVYIAKTLGMDVAEARTVVEHLAADYDRNHRGMRIVRIEDAYQMTSRPEWYPYIRQMIAAKAAQIHLTDTQMETLSIIAYRQPVTRLEVDDIRGVHSDAAINRLVEYGLIEEKGRLKAPGRPIQFGTTTDFLKYFNYASLEELPHYQEMVRERREEPNTQIDLADLEIVSEKNEEEN